ncbi:c-type cytochrome [Frateuria aurantia]
MRSKILIVGLFFWVAQASAQGIPGPKPARLGLCAACHGENGIGQAAGAPNLAGQREDYLRTALAEYRDGRRAIPLMRAAIGPISDAELGQLAHWYSQQTPADTKEHP